MFEGAGVFDRLLGLSRFLGESLSQGLEVTCMDRIELALELDAQQLESLQAQVERQDWGCFGVLAGRFGLCCQLGLEACDALFAVLDGEELENCWGAVETLEEACQLYSSAALDLDELREGATFLA